MLTTHIILAVLWVLYCVLHSVLAGSALKRKLQTWLKKRFVYYRIFYTLFAFVSLAALLWYQIQLPTIDLFEVTSAVLVIGSTIMLAGAVLMAVCIRKYFFSLSGLRSLVQESASNSLIITGVHRYVRHPLYLGTFVFIWGLLLVTPKLSLLIADAIITIYTLIGIGLEEKKLISEFGQPYRHYMQTVPKLWPLRRSGGRLGERNARNNHFTD